MALSALLAAHGFGMPADGVALAPADPRWPAGAARLIYALPEEIAWHHVGSTSVSGLPAKPIVDLLGELPAGLPLDALEAPIRTLGFLWLGEFGIPGRRFARLRVGATDYAHLHLFAAASPPVRVMLNFRDGLRRDPAAREAYAALKAASASAHAGNRDRYTESKGDFITAMLQELGASQVR